MTNENMIIVLLFVLTIALTVLYGIEKYKNRDLLWKGERYKEIVLKNINLQARSFGVMMRDWKRIEDGERIYYEKDHIRLIVEDGKVVGWYRP